MFCFGNYKKKKKPLDESRTPEQADNIRTHPIKLKTTSTNFLRRYSSRESRRSQSEPGNSRRKQYDDSREVIQSNTDLYQSDPIIRTITRSQDNSLYSTLKGQNSVEPVQKHLSHSQDTLTKPRRFTIQKVSQQHLSSTSNIKTADLSQVKLRPHTSNNKEETNRFSAPQLNSSDMLKYTAHNKREILPIRNNNPIRLSMIENRRYEKDVSATVPPLNHRSVSADPAPAQIRSLNQRNYETRNEMAPKSRQQRSSSPSSSELTVSDLNQIAARQQQQIKSQKNVLRAKEDRLKNLKRQYERQHRLQMTNDRLKELKDTIEDQNTRLNRLNKLRRSLEKSQRNNKKLDDELNYVKSLFIDKKQELSTCLQKVNELTREIQRLQSLNKSRPLPSTDNFSFPNTASDYSPLVCKSSSLSAGYNNQLKVSLKMKEAEKLDGRISEMQKKIDQAKLDLMKQNKRKREEKDASTVAEPPRNLNGSIKHSVIKETDQLLLIKESSGPNVNHTENLSHLNIHPSPILIRKPSVSRTKPNVYNLNSRPIILTFSRDSSTVERIRQTATAIYQPQINKIEQHKHSVSQTSLPVPTLASSEDSETDSGSSHSSKSSITTSDVIINIKTPSKISTISNICDQGVLTQVKNDSVSEPESNETANSAPPGSREETSENDSAVGENSSSFNEPSTSEASASIESPSPVECPLNKQSYNLDLLPSRSCMKQNNSNKSTSSVRFHPFALLLDASLEGDFELVKMCAEMVENISQSNDEGITALHNAICGEHIEIADFLIDSGANVNAFDNDGWTPLHCAVSCGLMGVTRHLVEAGAAVFSRTHSELKSPLDMSMSEDNEDVTQYIRKEQDNLGKIKEGKVYASFSYDALQPDELSFSKSEQLSVLTTDNDQENEWFLCKNSNGKEGLVPANYISNYKLKS